MTKNIERIYKVICNNLYMTTGNLSYDRIIDATLMLCIELEKDDGHDEFIWSIGEFELASLGDFITGSYWHFTDWHGGQESKSYLAYSRLGQIFTPNCAVLDDDASEKDVYDLWDNMAESNSSH